MLGTLNAPRTEVSNRAATNPARFALIFAQLVLVAVVSRSYTLESNAFGLLMRFVIGGFAIHYWLPFRYKEPFWIGLSVAGSFFLLDPAAAALLLASGLAFFGVFRSRVSYAVKLWTVIALFSALMTAKAFDLVPVPAGFWVAFGSIFMFRMMIYLYDLRTIKEAPNISAYLSYFFPLPNFYFILFPVVDYQTMLRSYYRRDIHEIAQQGVHWMCRGAVQLVMYRLVSFYRESRIPDNITSFGELVSYILLTYMLYLRLSGQFHMIVGMMHLFGYDLPETHRSYLLASSLTDFWRRINIYWKDFMVKLVYFPVYFRLRRSGETRAQVVATAAVFLVTWFLHAYQVFWLRGTWLFTWPDTIFWGLLGAVVIVNLLVESKKTGVPGAAKSKAVHAVKVTATFTFIAVLWSLWQSQTVMDWIDLITWWKLGV